VNADWAEALAKRGRTGDAERARALWQSACADAERLAMPGLLVRCRSALAEALHAAASAAPPVASDDCAPLVLEQRGDLWVVQGFGERVHVKTSRGMQLLARLCAEPGRELHVLELVDAAISGAAGPLLDERARAAYRTRLRELAAEREAAESACDLGTSERAAREIEALRTELERALGLGGRERKWSDSSERARSNVQRRIAHAVEQVRTTSARLGEHLAASVRTGTYCSYTPPTSLPLTAARRRP
jgi:hypothetical protein